ncbi:IS4 family transposase [Microbispora sp. NBC_01189]|uniref:IS4 family transposase n=1 Tax=Microbispora sp. NBC_01189 TaxID=2903583 RepID=UPI002E100B59|nr:IS4 family transposase [Microbispora sp. NBC_01189]
MARAGQQVKAGVAGVRLTDRIGIGVLTAAFPPDMVDVAVDEWDAREQRTRTLPARVMAYFAMAMIVYFDCGYSEVWNQLLGGLEWARTYRRRRETDMQPSTAALTKGRARLGWEPLAELLAMSMTPLTATPEQAPWAYWRGLRTLAIDGFTMNVQATPDNDAEFGRPGNDKSEGAFPQVRVVALAETGTRTLQGAEVGPLADGEQTLARKLWPKLGENDLVVADRLFLSHEDLAAITATGAHAIFRVKAGVDLPILEVLDDGTYRSRIADPDQARRLRRKKTDPAGIPGISVRIIEYSVSADPDDPRPATGDAPESELFCLATTLLDIEQYPLQEFPDRYAERWEAETVIGDVETRLRGGPEVVLRSKSPDMVRQEVYALLCVYQAIRHLITTAAERARLDPDRISFTRTAQAVRRQASDEAAFSPR